jgi:hypothetical protein
MLNSAIEIITLTAGTNYEPTFISTDKRRPSGMPTSLGYYQIGETKQWGYAKGPIFKIEFVDASSVSATHMKIWGIENIDDNLVPLYDITYLKNLKLFEIYLKKFEFCDSNGVSVEEETYTIVGHKKKVMPFNW